MRSLTLLRLAALAAVLFSLSCQKRGHFEIPCKIEKVIFKYRTYPTDPLEISTYTLTHNAWGDPVSIISSRPTTGQANHHFTYDNNHRLTTYRIDYGTEYIDYYTRYFYDSKGFIVRDTTWYAGYDINNPASFYQTIVNAYSYDSKGRVSRVNYRVLGIPASIHDRYYNYDANDNLIGEGFNYDNKTSFLRTSLVLAFIMRNYSKNNYVPALTYNSKNLPTSYPVDEISPTFLGQELDEIQYSCDDRDHLH